MIKLGQNIFRWCRTSRIECYFFFLLVTILSIELFNFFKNLLRSNRQKIPLFCPMWCLCPNLWECVLQSMFLFNVLSVYSEVQGLMAHLLWSTKQINQFMPHHSSYIHFSFGCVFQSFYISFARFWHNKHYLHTRLIKMARTLWEALPSMLKYQQHILDESQ